MMSKIWTNGDKIILLRRKHRGKRRNCTLRAIAPFLPQCFQKLSVVDASNSVFMEQRVKNSLRPKRKRQ